MHTLCTRHIKSQLCREAASKGGNISLNAALIALCFIDEIIQDKHRLVYSQGVDLVRYSPRDVWGADADDGLLGTGASWRTFKNPFRFSRSRNHQKRDPGQKPLLCICHVASWTLIIVNETEVGAGSSFNPPGRHQNAAVQRKALTQADTAAAASRKAASVSDRGGKKTEEKKTSTDQ